MEVLLKEFMEKMDRRLNRFEDKVSKELLEIRNTVATKEELSEIRATMSKEFLDIRKEMSTKEDVADIPLIRQAVLETRETVANLEKSVDELKNKDEEFALILAKQQKTIDLLSIKSIELEAQTRWA